MRDDDMSSLLIAMNGGRHCLSVCDVDRVEVGYMSNNVCQSRTFNNTVL